MKYNEQLYKKMSKTYWHGSVYPDIDKSKAYWGMFYITQDINYALEFSKKNPDDDWGYLYQCHIADNLYIFNAKDGKDRKVLRDWLVGVYRFSDSKAEEIIDKLAYKDWLAEFGNPGREKLISILNTLGYDGFFNFERSEFNDTEGNPSIGLFDANLIVIDKVYTSKEIPGLLRKLGRNE